MKIKSFNEYRKLVINGELTFEKLFKGTTPETVYAIARKIAKAYEKEILKEDNSFKLYENELKLIQDTFTLIFIFAKEEPQFRDMETEAIFYSIIQCAKDGVM